MGLNPTTLAALHSDERSTNLTLKFEVPVSGNQAKAERFTTMLDQIGLERDSHSLSGTDATIIDALDEALRLAPRRRAR